MRQGRADCAVALGRNGHNHKDAGRQAEALERMEVGERQPVPERLHAARHGPVEGGDDAKVEDVVEQQESVDDG